MEGKRTRGRPRTPWIDSIKEWRNIHVDWNEKMKRSAEDRSRWKFIIVNLFLEATRDDDVNRCTCDATSPLIKL